MRYILEKFIKRKNPDFQFDTSISNRLIIALLFDKSFYVLRGFLFNLIRLRSPVLFFLGKNSRWFNSRNIEIGKWARIEDGVYLSGLGKHQLKIGRSVSIGAFSQLVVSMSFNNIGEYIRIGNHVGIGQFASIGGSGGVTIGENCIIGQYFSCHPENHVYSDPEALIRNQGTVRSAITIGANCWIGAKVTVLAGVTIGEGCVIAAGAVVTKSMPAHSIIGGVPARVIKSRFE